MLHETRLEIVDEQSLVRYEWRGGHTINRYWQDIVDGWLTSKLIDCFTFGDGDAPHVTAIEALTAIERHIVAERDKEVMAKRAFDAEGGIDGLTKYLTGVQEYCDSEANDGSVDVRLRYHDGHWYTYSGSADYDQDHRGYWGASGVNGDMDAREMMAVAEDLLEQALEDIAFAKNIEELSTR